MRRLAAPPPKNQSAPAWAASYDVIVVGSGAGGLVAALRAKDQGLSVAVMEKTHFYGGTSAVSGGGVWVPQNDAIAREDTAEAALTYLRAASGGRGRDGALRAYVEHAPQMMQYLESVGVRYHASPGYPDYLDELPGVGRGRSLLPQDMDGALLGSEFYRLRDGHPSLLAFDRYALNSDMARAFNKRGPDWRSMALRMLWNYWSDLPWRLRTSRDRRLTWGRALVGSLRKAMLDRNIPLFLGTRLTGLDRVEGQITGARFQRWGQQMRVGVDRAVVLAAGGFEQNQAMRDQWLPVPTPVAVSPTPPGANTGDAIAAGIAVGAAIENMADAWWTPVVRMPDRKSSHEISYPLGNYRGRPGSLMVNRRGRRFANESGSYDRLAQEMIRDQRATGANAPCWLIFDTTYRETTPVGGLLPGWIMPDARVPPAWWDAVVFRSQSVRQLAAKVGLDADVFEATVGEFNASAIAGLDPAFGRGQSYFDRYNGDGACRPNPCLRPLQHPPYYAVSVDLGELGTKGGLRVDEHAAVLDGEWKRIPGLYAIGNTSSSLFIGAYPGGGATLGPSMTFGYLAADAIARETRMSPPT
jgi:3-oxosteroid 1-dehydrogenase